MVEAESSFLTLVVMDEHVQSRLEVEAALARCVDLWSTYQSDQETAS